MKGGIEYQGGAEPETTIFAEKNHYRDSLLGRRAMRNLRCNPEPAACCSGVEFRSIFLAHSGVLYNRGVSAFRAEGSVGSRNRRGTNTAESLRRTPQGLKPYFFIFGRLRHD